MLSKPLHRCILPEGFGPASLEATPPRVFDVTVDHEDAGDAPVMVELWRAYGGFED